jgi:hypothetical protein
VGGPLHRSMPMSQRAGALSLLSHSNSPRDARPAWGVMAFGLSVRSYLPLSGAVAGLAAPYRHTVEIRPFERDASAGRDGATLLERRQADGSLGMRVAALDDGGYSIVAPGHGTFRVAFDGSVICCGRLEEPSWRWQRPLCAQGLPLAATLQGFELFHASAVALRGRAIAFIAPSGTGKTSLAAQLTARGARLLTDDVLALECRDGTVLAHPGVPMANIASEQLELLSPAQRARLGKPIGTSDKVHVEVANMPGPLPLGAVFFLQRSGQIERIAFERANPPDPRDLLGATFMPHIITPARLTTQLHTCAGIAASVPAFKMVAPARLSAAELAIAVERQAATALG